MAKMERLSSDRRQHVRVPLSATVTFYHVPGKRTFPARSVDISQSGMLLYVPAGTPAASGQDVELTIESSNVPVASGVAAGQMQLGTIVRVDRPRMLKSGHLPVAVQFKSA